jgi:hypothetical protein
MSTTIDALKNNPPKILYLAGSRPYYLSSLVHCTSRHGDIYFRKHEPKLFRLGPSWFRSKQVARQAGEEMGYTVVDREGTQ